MTLRQAIESGSRGDFASALLRYMFTDSVETLVYMWNRADENNQERIRKVVPNIDEIVKAYYVLHNFDRPLAVHFLDEFPCLQNLNAEVENPHAIKI